MVRNTYNRELQRIQDEVLLLGSRVEGTINHAVEILKQRDHAAARKLIADDVEINKKRFGIEADTLSLIATQQPMAGDMRILAAVLEIVTELERLGDYAKGIAEISLRIGDEPLLKPLVDIPLMAKISTEMLHRSLDAFARRDSGLALEIPESDDDVDALYNQVYRELITFIIADPKVIDQANLLLWVAHNLERSADRVVNICERIIYLVSGNIVEIGNEGIIDY